MRKIFINKWFLLAIALTLSLSIFSFVAYHKTQSTCIATVESCQNYSTGSNERADLLWDLLSRQFSNFISIR